MPRNATVELAYIPLPAAITAVGPAKAAAGGFTELAYNVDQPLEPILFELHLPKFTVATLNATVTFFLIDITVAGKPQIFAEGTTEGITAAGSGAPYILKRRLIPSKDFTEQPELEGERKLSVEVECSAGTVTVPANTAKTVAYLKVDGLGRQ